MQRISDYRTRLMTRVRAERFARCLAANERFTGVNVQESSRARGEARHFVVFRPASEARQAPLLEAADNVRESRADAQANLYVFVLDDSGRFFHCLNLGSGEVYQTTEYSCDCPDYTCRCRSAGIRCKHIHALNGGRSEVRDWG